MSFIEELQKTVGPQLQSQLSNNLNIPSNQAGGILEKLAPLILGGLKRQMENHGGEKRVVHIVDKYGKEKAQSESGIADIISGVMKDRQPDPGLGGLLGNAGHQASEILSGELGIGKLEASRLIAIVAPIILGVLKSQHRAQPQATQTQAAENTGVHGAQTNNTQAKQPSQQGGGGILASILDRNGDGSVLDDVAGMVFNQGGGFGGRQQAGGLGGLLGSVLGGQQQPQRSAGGLGGILGGLLGGGGQRRSGGGLAGQVLGALLKNKR